MKTRYLILLTLVILCACIVWYLRKEAETPQGNVILAQNSRNVYTDSRVQAVCAGTQAGRPEQTLYVSSLGQETCVRKSYGFAGETEMEDGRKTVLGKGGRCRCRRFCI